MMGVKSVCPDVAMVQESESNVVVYGAVVVDAAGPSEKTQTCGRNRVRWAARWNGECLLRC